MLLAFFVLALSGCATTPTTSGQPADDLSPVTGLLVQKEEKIRQLEALVAEKEKQLQEKDSQIQELKGRLKSFGVF